jgi:NADH:ubiquinone oxidoreductase subunit K
VFIALNSAVRRQRRRLVMLAVMLGLAGAVVVAHSAMSHDHMGDVGEAVVMCLAVAETAVAAIGVALALAAWMRRPLWLVPQFAKPEPRFIPAAVAVPARAGPPLLQVFRL